MQFKKSIKPLYLILLIFLMGCENIPKEKCLNRRIDEVTYEVCILGNCRQRSKMMELCEVDRVGDKCLWHSKELNKEFWDYCEPIK